MSSKTSLINPALPCPYALIHPIPLFPGSGDTGDKLRQRGTGVAEALRDRMTEDTEGAGFIKLILNTPDIFLIDARLTNKCQKSILLRLCEFQYQVNCECLACYLF